MAMAALSASASPPFFHIGSSSYRNRRIDRKFRSIFFGALRIAKVEDASRRRQEFGLLVTAHLGQGDDIDLALDFLAQAPDNVQNIITRAEGWLYTVADAAITADTVTDGATDAATTSKDWLSGVTYVMETVLKLLNDGLTTLKIPYAYGFSIILLTVLVKAATFPLTKSQVESTISMQNLQPKIKAIQARYGGDQQRIQMETARLYKQAGVNPLAGCLPTLATLPVWIGLYRALSNVANEGLLTEGFFWIPSLAGPTSIAARQGGSGTSWLFPFVDGHPPLGWSEALAYLVLPLLLIGSQYVSMQLMQPPQTDPSQKTTNAVLKFLPLMIGYFALSVPSGLSLYWLTSNILSTGQQVWLKKLGGAKPAVAADGGNIISAGQAKRSSSSSSSSSSLSSSSSSMATLPSPKESRRGERFKQLKAAEMSRKKAARESSEEDDEGDGEGEGEGEGDGEGGEGEGNEGLKDSLEEMYANSGNGAATRNSLNKSKRSKRKRSV